MAGRSRSAPAAPAGLPGEQQQARKRRAGLRRRFVYAVGAVAGWMLLTFLVGPTEAALEPPPLGPASRDMIALRDFDDAEPVADLAVQQERAAAAVPVHYVFREEAVGERIDGLRAAFRLVRPRYRLYHADREALEQEKSEKAAARKQKSREQRRASSRKKRPSGDRGEEPEPDLVAELDARFHEDIRKLRPEFESRLAARGAALQVETFETLRKHRFSEEIELLLSDVVQSLLSQRIVKDKHRFEDDLARGLLDVSANKRYEREQAKKLAVSVERARELSDQYVDEFVRQKRPSIFDDAVLRAAVKSLARSTVVPTFDRDLEATERVRTAARNSVPKTRVVHFKTGQSLVKRGDVVTLGIQRRIAEMLRGLETSDTPRAFVATGLLLAAVLLLFSAFAGRYLPTLRRRPKDVALLSGILILHAVALRLLLELGDLVVEPGGGVSVTMWAVLLPYALGPTLATLFLRPMTAAPFALVTTVVAALMAHNAPLLRTEPLLIGLVAMCALILGLAGVYSTRRFRQRADLLIGAVFVAGFGIATATGVALFTAPVASDLFDLHNGMVVLRGAASGALSYLLVAALTPIFESIFKRLTDIKLLELTSMNHPALRLLATETPGTFTHSVMVGNLAEAACDAIGANGLLARVGAYYHDVGKTKAPRYFAENQTGENPHGRLKPHLSALIIKSHVKDGIKLLKGFGLPQEIIDFVPQHHGTSLIEHFHNLARREAVDSGAEVEEGDFRYPGPKPQTKEAALMMIADMVEAAAKAMPDPNPTRIQALVQRLIARKMEDGQFNECDMTLRELAAVDKAFTRVLAGMHHTRPVYLPPPERSDRAALLKSAREMRRHRTTGDFTGDNSKTSGVRETVRMESGVRDTHQDLEEEVEEAADKGDTVEVARVPAERLANGDEPAPPESPTAVVSSRRGRRS